MAAWYGRTYGVRVDPERVVVTPGTSGAFLNAIAVLLEEGDSLALTDPGYPCYPNFARLLGVRPCPVPVEPEDGFVPRREGITAALRSGAKALLVASPANPTGAIIPPGELEWMSALPVPLISDEIYHGLVYCDACTATALQFSDDAIVINGLSKRLAMTGMRIGWAIVPAGLAGRLIYSLQRMNHAGCSLPFFQARPIETCCVTPRSLSIM